MHNMIFATMATPFMELLTAQAWGDWCWLYRMNHLVYLAAKCLLCKRCFLGVLCINPKFGPQVPISHRSVSLIFLLPQAAVWLSTALLLILSLFKTLIFCSSWIFLHWFWLFKYYINIFFILTTDKFFTQDECCPCSSPEGSGYSWPSWAWGHLSPSPAHKATSSSFQAAVTRWLINNKCSFLTVPEAGKSSIRTRAHSVSGDSAPQGCRLPTSPCGCHAGERARELSGVF